MSDKRLWCEAPTVKRGKADCTRHTKWRIYASRDSWLWAFPYDQEIAQVGENYTLAAYMCGNHAHVLEEVLKIHGYRYLERVDLDGPDGLFRR